MSEIPYRITFRGPFAVHTPVGTEITPKGLKARALIALVAEAPDRKRARRWLEARLWSDRGPAQAAGSLRQCLFEIRTAFGAHSALIQSDRSKVWLLADRLGTDLEEAEGDREILEGLDVPDPEFEDWLRMLRQRHDRREPRRVPPQGATVIRGLRVHCLGRSDGPAQARITAQILADQIGRNIEDHVTAWRVSDLNAEAIRRTDLEVVCELSQSATHSVAFLRIVHLGTRRVLFSGFRQAATGVSQLLSDEGLAEFAHDAAMRCLERLPLAVGLDQPEAVAAGFAQLALRRLSSFETGQIAEADGLMARAHAADGNALWLGWRGFLSMARVVDRQDAAPELRDEAHAFCRTVVEKAGTNAQALALVALTRTMLFDDVEGGGELARLALVCNPANLFARQVLAVINGAAGRHEDAYALSSFCQPALAREDLRHLWDLYHCLVCISTRRFDEATAAAKRAIARAPSFAAPRRQLVALAIHAGDHSEARQQVEALARIEAGFSVDRMLRDPEYPVTTLRRAGLMEFNAASLER